MGLFRKVLGFATGADAHAAVLKKTGVRGAAADAAAQAPKLGAQLLDAADVLAGAALVKRPGLPGAAFLERKVAGRRVGAFVLLALAFALPASLFVVAGRRFVRAVSHPSHVAPVPGTLNGH